MKCSRCSTLYPAQATHCPTCGKTSDYFGVPIIKATNAEVLCTTCIYHAEETCTLPNYPRATQCTLYRDQRQPQAMPLKYRPRQSWGLVIGTLILAGISILLALKR